jgi:hypothetical protein
MRSLPVVPVITPVPVMRVDTEMPEHTDGFRWLILNEITCAARRVGGMVLVAATAVSEVKMMSANNPKIK